MKKALAFLLLALSAGAAHSGYFVTGLTGVKAGYSTACYLMPSMAAQALYNSSGYVNLTELSETAGAGYPTGYTTQVYTFSVATCNAAPAATSFPTFIGSASDPVLVSGNYGTGTTGGTSGECVLTMPNTYDPVTSFMDGLQMGWAVAAAMIGVYVIRRVYR